MWIKLDLSKFPARAEKHYARYAIYFYMRTIREEMLELCDSSTVESTEAKHDIKVSKRYIASQTNIVAKIDCIKTRKEDHLKREAFNRSVHIARSEESKLFMSI